MGKKVIDNALGVTYNYFEYDLNKKFAMGNSGINQLSAFLKRTSLSSTFLYNDQSEYIVSVRAYPFWANSFFETVGPLTTFSIGPFSASDVGVSGSAITQQKKPVSLGSMAITRQFNNFMDYAPYTKITAYIPYIGFRDLDVNQIMGKTIEFFARVDFDNGILTVWLQIDDAMIQSWENQVGFSINLNRTNAHDHLQNMYVWGVKALTGLLGSPLQSNAKAIKTGSDISTGFIGANQRHVRAGEIASGQNNLFNPTSIYLIYQRPNPTPITSEYNKLYGMPLNESKTLSTLTGYTKVGSIHITDIPNATSEEISMIENELKNGVIL